MTILFDNVEEELKDFLKDREEYENDQQWWERQEILKEIKEEIYSNVPRASVIVNMCKHYEWTKLLDETKEKVYDACERGVRGEIKESIGEQVKNQLLANKTTQATELLVEYILKNNKIFTIREDCKDPEIWIYRDGIYEANGQTYIEEIARETLGKGYTTYLKNQIIAKIVADTRIKPEDFYKVQDVNKIAVKNGILNLITHELEPFSDEYLFFNKINAIFDKTKDCPNIIKFFQSIISDSDILIIQELFGYLLYREYKIPKAIMMSGEGRNGKGKTAELIKHFLGPANVTNISLEDLENKEFVLGNLFNKLVCLSPDISDRALKNTSIFKSVTGGDMLSSNRKFKSYLHFVNYAKLVYGANCVPRSRDLTPAFFSRWIIIDFPYSFYSQNEINNMEDTEKVRIADRDILKKLISEDEMSGLLNWALEGLRRLLDKGDFTYSRTTEEIKKDWIRRSDSIEFFLNEYVKEDDPNDYRYVVKKDFRYWYNKFCKKHKLKPVSDKWIKDVIERHGGTSEYRTVGGHDFAPRKYVWSNIELNEEKLLAEI